LCRGIDLQRRCGNGSLINRTVSKSSIIQTSLSDIPLCFVGFDLSTFIFAEALPLLNTPKFAGGSIYARLDKEKF